MPPTCSLSALLDLPAKHGIQIHTSKKWLEKGRRAAHSTCGMARQKPKEDNYYEPLWKAFK